MKKALAALRMLVIGGWILSFLITIGLPVLVYCRITGNPLPALRLTKVLDRVTMFLARIRVEVMGAEKVPPNRGCVYVANHRSHADPPVLFLTLPGFVTFMAKKELFRIPLLGFAISTLGTIEVDRSRAEAAAASVDRAATEIRKGKSVLLFPEGTRSRSHSILPFKKGAFVLALKARAPIIPVTVIGTDKAMPPDSFLLYPGTVKILIHDPVMTEHMTLTNRDELMNSTRATIARGYEERDAAT